jgi:hypothetical protein
MLITWARLYVISDIVHCTGFLLKVLNAQDKFVPVRSITACGEIAHTLHVNFRKAVPLIVQK